MTGRRRREDSNKFVKTLERDITGTQRRCFKISKRLPLQEIGKLKIDPITKVGMERMLLKTGLSRTAKGKKEQKRRGAVK
jgi:hypothetical protein